MATGNTSHSTSLSEFTVTLRNRGGAVLRATSDQAIIDVAEAAGHVLPIACRYGGCITCAARLVSGRVVQPNATALNRQQHNDGYILVCVARPRSDLVLDVGVETQDGLYINPFLKATGFSSANDAAEDEPKFKDESA